VFTYLYMEQKGLTKIQSVLEFNEKDPDQGVERTYMYYKTSSHHIHTPKQTADILTTNKWRKMLFLDSILQSTTQDEILYHTALVHPIMDTLQNKENILILGGGEGATAREVLRWNTVKKVTMVDYDRELVSFMKEHGKEWSAGAFDDRRLTIIYEDAWKFMNTADAYDGVIVDLTDPNLSNDWEHLLENVLQCVKSRQGGFTMNAGLYLPWNTENIRKIKTVVEHLCIDNPDYRYSIYTIMIPSFNGEWTFVSMFHKGRFMRDPEKLHIIPDWIRRGVRSLENKFIDTNISTVPDLRKIHVTNSQLFCSII
jgi:spermidine synthase